jgi:predicted AlkP superfamily phosphohydrolase/phosphomutase
VVVFTGTDRMGHYLWPYHRHPQAGDPLQVQELCRAVHSYYVRLDQVVGELTARGGRDTTSILMSDHGMGPKNTRWIHLNNWLYQNGWLSAKAAGSQIANPDGWLRRLGLSRDKAGRMISRIPGLARSRLIKSVAQKRSIGVDMAHSKAYGVQVWGNITGIQIDLEGPEKEALRQEIVEGLARIVDPETGQPVVQRVYRGQDCYHGPYANHIPEIIVVFDPDYACNYHLGHYSSIVTRLQAVSSEGYHRIEGIFVASGPDVVSNPGPLSGLAIEDLAPTVLYLMDLPIPADMDGRVLTEILSPAGLESRPVRPGEPSGLWPDEGQAVFIDEALADRDEGEVRGRLRALGYLD